jgi:hypothetical protein
MKTLVEEVNEFLDRVGEMAVAEQISDAAIVSRAAAINGKLGGRKKVLRSCPYGCKQVFGSREMKAHLPKCPKRVSAGDNHEKAVDNL